MSIVNGCIHIFYFFSLFTYCGFGFLCIFGQTTNTTIMKNQFTIGTFKTNNGNIFEIKKIITGTMLNTFCDEPIMYDVVWIDNQTRPFSPRGIRSIIKNQ